MLVLVPSAGGVDRGLGITDSQTLYAVADGHGGVLSVDRTGVLVRTSPRLGSAKELVAGAGSTTSALGADNATETLVLGLANGEIRAIGPDFKLHAKTSLQGRIVALARGDQATIYAAYGYGQYGNNYTIGMFSSAQLTMLAHFPAGAAVTALAGGPARTLYIATAQGTLIRVTPIGTPLCRVALNAPATTVLVDDRGRAIAGDQDGGVEAIDPSCKTAWSAHLAGGAVRSLYVDHDVVVAGGDDGTVATLGQNGQRRSTVHVGTSPIRGIVGDGRHGEVVAIPQAGERKTIRTTVLSGSRLLPLRRGILLVLDTGGLVALVLRIRRSHPAVAKRYQRLVRTVWRNRTAYIFSLPAVAIIALFFYYPVATAVQSSFTDVSLSSSHSHWVGLANYREVIFHDKYFHKGLGNLLILLGASLIKTFTVPLLAAELVFWLRNAKHRYIYRALIVLPAVVPDLVVTLLWKTIYQPDGGLLNAMLQAAGLKGFQHVWLGEAHTALIALIAVGFPFLNAFAFLIFYGGLLQIDQQIFEAATLDGVSAIRRFVSIDLPQIKPQVRIMALFAIIGAVQGFANVFVLTGGGPSLATYVPALEMYQHIGQGDIGYASTIGVVLSAGIVAVTVLLRARSKRTSQ